MTDGAIPLIEKVRSAGVVDHYVLLGEGNMRRWDWEKMSPKMSGDTRTLWRLLLLGEKVAAADAEKILGKRALGFLSRHKLCHSENGQVSLGGACLLMYRNFLFFADTSTMQRTLFSDETRALISLLPDLKKGRCLCLYPSTGAEILPLAAQPGVEVVFLQNERKRTLLGANLEMAAGKKPVFVTKAAAVKGKFDLITAWPPSCISVPGMPLPDYLGGGPDGCHWVRDALEIARKALAPDGRMAMVFTFFSDNQSPTMEAQMRSMLEPFGLSYRMLISSKMLLEPGVPMFNQLVALSAHFTKEKKPETVVADIMAYLKEKQYSAVYLVKAVFTRPGDEGRKEEITNYSDDYYGGWTI
jgi:hypothetical protein